MRHTIRPGCPRTRAISSHRTASPPAKRQSGQALIFGMFLLVIVAVLTFYQFSTGQVTTARMRLVNATDAAAYSAGLWRARAFNYYAYSNRAIIFNEVAIAQTATLVSYAGFITQAVNNVERISRLFPPLNAYLRGVNQMVEALKQALHMVAGVEIGARSAYIKALAASQSAMFTMTSGPVLSRVTYEVAKKTDPNFFAHVLQSTGQDLMTKNHSGDDRDRLRTMINRSLDPYSTNRSSEIYILGTKWLFKLSRRGQTELLRDNKTDTYERWQSYDTMSLHFQHFRRGKPRWDEAFPISWSGAEAAADPKRRMDDLATASPDKSHNQQAYRRINRSEFWSSGAHLELPGTRELNYESSALKQNDRFPTNRIGVVGFIRGRNDIRTADQAGLGAGRLKLQDALPRMKEQGNAMMVVSAAEVYFRRPPEATSRVEYASLYSPYWQVRLAEVPVAWRVLANTAYGVGK